MTASRNKSFLMKCSRKSKCCYQNNYNQNKFSLYVNHLKAILLDSFVFKLCDDKFHLKCLKQNNEAFISFNIDKGSAKCLLF